LPREPPIKNCMEQWISKETLLWISVAGLLIGLVVVPWIMVKMPADSFSNMKRYSWLDRKPAAVRVPLRILKNLLALGLIILGAMMFVTPGPGMFPIGLGILLADFPGKLRLQRWFLCRPKIMKSLNWLRQKFRRPPFRRPFFCDRSLGKTS
jgi:hypothetical protein